MSTTATNPERLKQFLQPVSALPTINYSTLSTLKSTGLTASATLGGSQRKHVNQIPPIQRGDLKAFQTTFRGGANLLAPPPPDPRCAGTVVASPTLPERPPDVGVAGGRSLDDVWKKGLFATAPGITEVDRARIMRPDSEGNVGVIRMKPDRFVMGRVLPPEVTVETMSAAALHDDGARLMHPRERRALHDAEVNARQGYLALRDAYKARRKLTDTCAINYPHGVLGCSETPYAAGALASDVYRTKAAELVAEDTRAQRKGRNKGVACPAAVPATGLDVGAVECPTRATGRARRNVPPDTLSLASPTRR